MGRREELNKMAKVVIDQERCKGCGLCVAACNFGNLRIGENFNSKSYKVSEFVGEDCKGCGFCYMVCPDTAITVYRDEKVEVEK